jgi:hypothetical protein
VSGHVRRKHYTGCVLIKRHRGEYFLGVALKATITAFLSAILYLSKQRTGKTPLNRYLNRQGYFK